MNDWTRKFWGVAYQPSKFEQTILIGRLWHELTPKIFNGEPTRAMLFTTRKAAREWCKCQRHVFRFRPVRVRETVEVVLK